VQNKGYEIANDLKHQYFLNLTEAMARDCTS